MTDSLTQTREARPVSRLVPREEMMAEKSFSELYRLHVNNIYYYLLSRVRNSADAEDLTSQTFITALENRHRLRNPDKFTPWLYSIARNKANDYFRRAARRTFQPLEDDISPTPSPDPQESQLKQERLLDIERLVSQLSPSEQDYLRLRLIAELPFAEIAQVMRQSETRVKKSYYRLLERLQAQME